MDSRRRALVWMAVGALAATLPVWRSGARAAQDTPLPTFRTEVNYVRVDLFPTTRDGAPVLDLRQDEVRILEDGTPQKIEQFEHVQIRGNVPQDARSEPATVAESRAALQNPRARVFVLFLDTLHVEQSASRSIQQPLIQMLERLLGPDDLVAVMTPAMSVADVTFARKTTILQGFLSRSWWGERDAAITLDPIEEQYKQCFPALDGRSTTSAVAKAMIDRRREQRTLEALGQLVQFLRTAREERKAIIAITDGWVLFRPDDKLTNQTDDRQPPPIPGIEVDPRNGRFTTRDTGVPGTGSNGRAQCERDRIALAQLDDEDRMRRLLDEANRANASFYPVDPRGLVVFDTPIGPDPPPTLQQDSAQLRQRSIALRDLAASTDGTAVVGTNNISGALTRIVADLSSYYLLGYYSTNAKLDGRFRSISVRVSRPGVQVRARRGYLAASAAEAAAARSPGPGGAAAVATNVAIDAVVGSLARFSRDTPLRTQAAAGWNVRGAAAVWVVGEVAASEKWIAGGEATVTLMRGDSQVSSAKATMAPGARTFKVLVPASEPVSAGEYQIRVRVRGTDGSGGPLDDAVVLAVVAPPGPNGALLLRRGPSTANRSVPTADSRFRRTERLAIEMPAPESPAMTARLLDRTGKPLPIPATVTARTDADGSSWQTAELVLAPLAPADYVVELAMDGSAGQTRTLVPFRIVP